MSDVAVSNQPYVNQSTYDPSVYETQNTQDLGVVSPDYNQAKLQGSVDSALVEALLQMLVGLAQNHGLPKYKLNEIIDFLKDFLTQGGTPAVGDTGAVGGSGQPSGGVHLDAGEVIKVGDVTVVPMDENGRHTSSQPYENAVFILPGQTVEVNGLKITNDTVPSPSLYAYIDQPQPAPVTTQPVISNPVVSQPAQPIMSLQEFANRYTVNTLMEDGSYTPTTNSLAEKAFGIPVGTPLSQVDLTKLKPVTGSEGTVISPVKSSAPATTTEATTQTQANASMQEAAGLLNKINTGTATQEDVKAFLAKLQELAQKFSESIGDGATEGAVRKAKKVAANSTTSGEVAGSAGSVVASNSSPAGFDTANGMAGGFSGSTTGKSWLMAIAEAMGNVLGSKVQQMLNSSGRMASLTNDQKGLGAWQDSVSNQLDKYVKEHKAAGDFDNAKYQEEVASLKPQQDKIDTAMKANGQEFTVESSKLQGASQEFSMLQNAFSNAIKSIGEGLGQLARKG